MSQSISRSRGRQRQGSGHRQTQTPEGFSPTPLALTTTTVSRSTQSFMDVPSDRANDPLPKTIAVTNESISSQIRSEESLSDRNDSHNNDSTIINSSVHRKNRKNISKSILVTLSDNCRKHHISGQKFHDANCCLAHSWSDVPQYCQKALLTLKGILPKVERTILISDDIKCKKSVVDLRHICDFYNDVLVGGFCPNALHLFNNGKDAIEILPRVFTLFQHLASKALIHDTSSHIVASHDLNRDSIEPPNGKNGGNGINTSSRPKSLFDSCAWSHICMTISSLLNCVPDSQLQTIFVRDLIHMVADLSVLQESNILSVENGVEVTLFEETRQHILQSMITSENNPLLAVDFWIPINNADSLFSIKSACFCVLNNLLTKKKFRLLYMPGIEYHLDQSRSPFSLDLNFNGKNDMPDNDDLPLHILISSIRQSLVSNTQYSNPSNPNKDSLALQAMAQTCAIASLHLLLSDWIRAGFPSLGLLQEVSMLVSRGAFVQLELCFRKEYIVSDEVIHHISAMLHSLITWIPRVVHGSSSLAENTIVIQSTNFITLLSTINFVHNNATIEFIHENKFIRQMIAVILRTLYASLKNSLSKGLDDTHSCSENQELLKSSISVSMHQSIKSIFSFLCVPDLAEYAVRILSLLLLDGEMKRVCELEWICEVAVTGKLDLYAVTGKEHTTEEDFQISPIDNHKRKLVTEQYLESIPKKQKRFLNTGCLDDHLAIFMSSALVSSVHLRTLMSERGGSFGTKWETSDGSIESHIQRVSAASIVLSTFLDQLRGLSHNGYAKIRQLLDGFLITLNILGEWVVKFINESWNELPDTVAFTIPILIRFCIQMPTAIAKTSDEDSDNLMEHLFYILQKAKRMFYYLLDSTDFNDTLSIPVCLSDAIFSSMIYRCPYVTLRFPSAVTVLGGVWVKMEADDGCLTIPNFQLTGPFFHAADINESEERSFQTRLLKQHLKIEDSTTTEPFTLLNATIERIKSNPGTRMSTAVRLSTLQSINWIMLHCSSHKLREAVRSSQTFSGIDGSQVNFGVFLIEFLLQSSFSDPDTWVRTYSSRKLGLLLAANNWAPVINCLASDKELKAISEETESRYRNKVIDRLFGLIDIHLHKCDWSSQCASGDDNANKSLACRGSAARSLSSLCQASSDPTYINKLVFERAFLRLIRFWAGSITVSSSERNGMFFAELLYLLRASFFHRYCNNDLASFSPAIFREILIPSTSSSGMDNRLNNMKRFRQLSDVVQLMLTSGNNNASTKQIGDLNSIDLVRFLDSVLPHVIAQFIIDKDYIALQITAGYKFFLLQKRRNEDKSMMKVACASYSNKLHTSRVLVKETFEVINNTTLTLDEQTRDMCIAPTLIERILPLILGKAERSELLFFTKTVLQERLSLHVIIKSREQLILKELVQAIGRASCNSFEAVRALQTAAIAKSQGESSILFNSNNKKKKKPREIDVSEQSEVSALTDWITQHFMYLLVNVVQYRWTSKTAVERTMALRCLCVTLDFLHSKESPQYLPQILSTVSSAISTYCKVVSAPESQQLRLLSISVLTKFVRLVAQHNWEIIGQNLTNITVTIIPLVTEDESDFTSGQESIVLECQRKAVELLEWMSRGELGKNLSPFFSEIPFLPPSTMLDPFRASLRALGVDFDNLNVADTLCTQLENHTMGSHNSETEASVDINVSTNSKRQVALRRRLEMIRPLLANENASIRKVILKHLTSLLRANRTLFHVLVQNEGSASMKRYLTIAYPGTSGVSRGAVTEIVEALLSRCVHEDDPEARILLATCFGEVGAIDEHHLEEMRPVNISSGEGAHINMKAPWRSRPIRYQLKLVTSHLVIALKAALTVNDQHKIAFTIQELLSLIDKSSKEGANSSARVKEKGDTEVLRIESINAKPLMSDWLSAMLRESNVFDVIEPYWYTEFHEAENIAPKNPPFFSTSTTCFGWLSQWCRYMVHRSHRSNPSKWSEMFHSCRTVMRTAAGSGVAEFLLPMLILDRLCFGDGQDEQILIREIRDALFFDNNEKVRQETMPITERQKAANVIFKVVDLFQFWSETETELRYTSPRQQNLEAQTNRQPLERNGDEWPKEESVMRIDDMIKHIPLAFRAHAAANVGMHAYALRLIEMNARSLVAHDVFNADSIKLLNKSKSRAAGTCGEKDSSFMKDVLFSLNDYETMLALGQDDFWSNPTTRVNDSIRKNEALGDWEAALQDYERAQQLNGHNMALQHGSLKCLLELGHFETVLQQVRGMISLDATNNRCDANTTIPFAIEAACRLGRWDTLADLVTPNTPFSAFSFQSCLGEAMLHAHNQSVSDLHNSLSNGRQILLEGLSSVARESYSRAYDHIVRLQGIREIEDISMFLCSKEKVTIGDIIRDAHFGWERRLELTSSYGGSAIINTRLALARLAGDHTYEASLFLSMGKRARKKGLHGVAASSFAQAETIARSLNLSCQPLLLSSLKLQLAKLKHDCGESSIALRMLEQGRTEISKKLGVEIETVRQTFMPNRARSNHTLGMDDDYVKSVLQSTRWMIDGSLKGSSEIMTRFKLIHQAAPKWEKGHFQYAKYMDSVLRSRIVALTKRSNKEYVNSKDDALMNQVIAHDKYCQKYLLRAMKHYATSLSLDIKHVYQSLPRLLSLWFDFTNIKPRVREKPGEVGIPDIDAIFSQHKDEANTIMAKEVKVIPPHAFYTAMPQLISCMTHNDKKTSSLVRGILKCVLINFPAQAMWPLAWVRQSRDPERCDMGNAIFREAEITLKKDSNQILYRLLVASESLCEFLHSLAKYEVKDKHKSIIRIKPWRGEVDLFDFIPPIQAALSVSLISGSLSRTTDVFPRHVPRMRDISPEIQVMSSKARPKKIKVYVVSSASLDVQRKADKKRSDNIGLDIGEIHFLVKQEADGDLRKDARVQDLNNVINRLMAASNDRKGAQGQRRRLHLRTFAVTCLSEETGLLEWVPNTDSLRNLVSASYNPQASPFSNRRRGKRIISFSDPSLRETFEKKCQAMYFKSGDLKKAALLFDELCLKPFPPLLYWWFVHNFHDPHAWYEARTRFTLSAAIWSGVGHVIGLGDRHSENILVDTSSAECVHVDFDCIFDKGLTLPKPEVIPFRLTQNMIDAFGPTGADGIYSENLKVAMSTLRHNRDTLLSVLEPFLNDPVIFWKKHRGQQQSSGKVFSTNEAKRSINVIDERLQGIYNISNPNFSKVPRTDGVGEQLDEELGNLLPLSVEGQVHKMIAEATNNENLVQLFFGWMPWV